MKANTSIFYESRQLSRLFLGSGTFFAEKLTLPPTAFGKSIVQSEINIARDAVICFFFVFAIILTPLTARASQQQSLASIVMQAEAFIEQYDFQSPYPAGIKIKPLDKRLRLQACFKPLDISFTRADMTYGNTSLTIKCPTKPYWKFLLPATITLYDDVLVTRRPLLKDEVIDPSTIRVKKQNITSLHQGYFKQNIDVSHLQARRNLGAGTILTPNTVAPRLMVKSGQIVTIVLDYQGIAIRTSGKALQSAKLGDIVRVRNLQTSRVVEGIVQGDALVRVGI